MPLITLPLERMASRVSASLLAAAGLRLLVTRTLADYYLLSAALISSPTKLQLTRTLTVAVRGGGGGGGDGGGSSGGGVFDAAAWVARCYSCMRPKATNACGLNTLMRERELAGWKQL